MSLTLQLRDRIWTISCNEQAVAEIRLDYWDQVHDVVLYADTSPEVQLSVLRLAASHSVQFMKNRTYSTFGGLMVAEHRNLSLTSYDSVLLMDVARIPEHIQELTQETIEHGLRSLRINVVVGTHRTAAEALRAVMAEIGHSGLHCRRIPQLSLSDNEIGLRFTVAKPDRFIFWKSQSKPRADNIYVVPSYHPVMQGWKSVGMVNGDTDFYIRGCAVRHIYCPVAARSVRKQDFSSTWRNVKHPFYATGRSFSLSINTINIRSQEGVHELADLLRAALGKDERYVEINGGFRAPMQCAHNRLLDIGRKSPWPHADRSGQGNIARGSEQHCVWAHRTLEKEGVLDQAHVPQWFYAEGWLDIYKGAKVRPTLF